MVEYIFKTKVVSIFRNRNNVGTSNLNFKCFIWDKSYSLMMFIYSLDIIKFVDNICIINWVNLTWIVLKAFFFNIGQQPLPCYLQLSELLSEVILAMLRFGWHSLNKMDFDMIDFEEKYQTCWSIKGKAKRNKRYFTFNNIIWRKIDSY